MQNQLNRRYFYPLIWYGLIIYASVTPSNKLPEFKLFPHFDKVVHFGIYFGLAVLLTAALVQKAKYMRSYFWAGVFSFASGVAFEIIQKFLTTTRSGEMADIVFNTLGTVVGLLFYHFAIKGKWIERIVFNIKPL
jgi:VanZ family protein